MTYRSLGVFRRGRVRGSSAGIRGGIMVKLCPSRSTTVLTAAWSQTSAHFRRINISAGTYISEVFVHNKRRAALMWYGAMSLPLCGDFKITKGRDIMEIALYVLKNVTTVALLVLLGAMFVRAVLSWFPSNGGGRARQFCLCPDRAVHRPGARASRAHRVGTQRPHRRLVFHHISHNFTFI